MKKIKCIIILAFIITNHVKSDVIYTPYKEVSTALSIECIFSYELPISRLNTLNYWCGFGGVSMIQHIRNPAFGIELAVEIRQYFKSNTFKGFNIGLYGGVGYMRHPSFYSNHVSSYNNSFGFVPGLKITYKQKFNSWLFGEPYIGISLPMYDNDAGLIFTIGLRIGFNKVWMRKE